MNDTVIITGASGFIGRKLTEVLLSRGNKVIALVPDPERLTDINDINLLVINAGFDDFNRISQLVSSRKVDYFYYLAWYGYGVTTNDYKYQIANIKPVCDAVVEAAKIGCKRFIFTSSFSEYMIKENESKTHDMGAVCNVYGSAKHAARLLAQSVASQCGIEFVSTAFANTFGPGDFSKRSTNTIISKLLKNTPIDLTEGIHLYDWNYIDDTVEGLILAATKGKCDAVYYIGNNSRRPLKEIVEQVRDYLAPQVPIRLGTYKEDFHVDYSCVDVHQLYRDTGFLATHDFKESVLATADWVKTLSWYIEK